MICLVVSVTELLHHSVSFLTKIHVQYFSLVHKELHQYGIRITPLCFHHSVVIVPYQQASSFSVVDMAKTGVGAYFQISISWQAVYI